MKQTDTRSSIVRELEGKINKQQEEKWFPKFGKQAQHMGNGIYNIGSLYSNDTRELFLMFVADREDVDYDGKTDEPEDEVA